MNFHGLFLLFFSLSFVRSMPVIVSLFLDRADAAVPLHHENENSPPSLHSIYEINKDWPLFDWAAVGAGSFQTRRGKYKSKGKFTKGGRKFG